MDLFAISARVAAEGQTGVVEKTPNKEEWCVKSEHNPDWSGGCYPSKTKADERLGEVEAAKHAKASVDLVMLNCATILSSDYPSHAVMDSFRKLLAAFNSEDELVDAEHVSQEEQQAKAPPGWKKTVEEMKEHEEIDNPFALAWYMKNKGDKPHKK